MKSKAESLADSANLGYRVGWQREAAYELRRLDAANRDLLDALITLRGACIAAGWLLDADHAYHMDQSRAAIAKATGND